MEGVNDTWAKNMCFVYNLLLFPTAKESENRLGFDKVIAIGWWSTLSRHSVYVTKYCIMQVKSVYREVEVQVVTR